VGGQWRSRKVEFPSIEGLRPTHDRIRETLFNWLQADIAGARCLDLFAGSGALGLEALSRGASVVTFVDNNREACDAIKGNVKKLETENGAVFCGDFKNVPLSKPYDIVFLDPPFRSELLQEALYFLREKKLLKEHALVYVESDEDLEKLVLSNNEKLIQKKATKTLRYGLIGLQ